MKKKTRRKINHRHNSRIISSVTKQRAFTKRRIHDIWCCGQWYRVIHKVAEQDRVDLDSRCCAILPSQLCRKEIPSA